MLRKKRDIKLKWLLCYRIKTRVYFSLLLTDLTSLKIQNQRKNNRKKFKIFKKKNSMMLGKTKKK